MNSRDLTLISTAAVAGAVAAAIATRFLQNPRKKFLKNDDTDDVVRKDTTSNDPYDTSKRNGTGCSNAPASLLRRGAALEFRYCTVYLSWDDYFMAIAFLSSEDPRS
ncbi:hypothetical protein Tco_0594036 [Tanacetum coccineum]